MLTEAAAGLEAGLPLMETNVEMLRESLRCSRNCRDNIIIFSVLSKIANRQWSIFVESPFHFNKLKVEVISGIGHLFTCEFQYMLRM